MVYEEVGLAFRVQGVSLVRALTSIKASEAVPTLRRCLRWLVGGLCCGRRRASPKLRERCFGASRILRPCGQAGIVGAKGVKMDE